MSTPISDSALQSLVREIEAFPVTEWHGLSASTILDSGVYEERGLRLDIDDLKLGQHYSALSVLSRDIIQHLAQHPRKDALLFNAVTTHVAREEQSLFGAGAFPVYTGQPTAALPKGMAAAAAEGKLDLSPLGDPEIVHEWTSKAGRRLFDQFVKRLRRRIKFKEPVCKRGGLKDKLTKGKMGEAKVIAAVIQGLLLLVWPAAFWAPLATVSGTLLVKRGLIMLCKK